MKTTVDLPDDLVFQGKKAALERGTTLKCLIEKGLYREIYTPTNEVFGAIKNLKELDASIWKAVDADQFVKEQRENWE